MVAVEEGESYGFRTKGDNNEDVDPYFIPAENVVGRYYFKVDNAGRVVEYLKTPLGFILLGLCGLALIAAEISTMLEVRWKEAARADTRRNSVERSWNARHTMAHRSVHSLFVPPRLRRWGGGQQLRGLAGLSGRRAFRGGSPICGRRPRRPISRLESWARRTHGAALAMWD